MASIIGFIFLGVGGFYEHFGIEPFIFPIILLALSIIGFLITGFIHLIDRKKKSVASEESVHFPRYSDRFQSQYSQPYESNPGIDKTGLKDQFEEDTLSSLETLVDWQKIIPLIYKGDPKNQICPICKLVIRNNTFVLQCPHCQSIYHGEHFIDWLYKEKKCPICLTHIDVE